MTLKTKNRLPTEIENPTHNIDKNLSQKPIPKNQRNLNYIIKKLEKKTSSDTTAQIGVDRLMILEKNYGKAIYKLTLPEEICRPLINLVNLSYVDYKKHDEKLMPAVNRIYEYIETTDSVKKEIERLGGDVTPEKYKRLGNDIKKAVDTMTIHEMIDEIEDLDGIGLEGRVNIHTVEDELKNAPPEVAEFIRTKSKLYEKLQENENISVNNIREELIEEAKEISMMPDGKSSYEVEILGKKHQIRSKEEAVATILVVAKIIDDAGTIEGLFTAEYWLEEWGALNVALYTIGAISAVGVGLYLFIKFKFKKLLKLIDLIK